MTNWMRGARPTRFPGVWKTKKGYRVRVRAIDPRTDTQRERNEEFEGITIEEAVLRQQAMRAEIKVGAAAEPEKVRFGDYVESLLRSKVATGELSTEKGQRTWSDAHDLHLLPHFEDWYLHQIRRKDIEDWKTEQAMKVRRGTYSPNTVNGWLRVLLSTLRSAVAEYELEYDPTLNVKPLDTSTWETYTDEEPNSLTVKEVPRFMSKAHELYPQFYAQLVLGLATGRRPCELRPLRWKGPTPDILWEEGVLLVRRSQVIGEASNRTKTKAKLKIPLPPDLMSILREHVDALPWKLTKKYDLLFPPTHGSYQSASVLAKPIVEIAEAAKIKKHLSPKFMRRTFQDLCRAANVHDFVARAISGHATIEMQEHYSSVAGEEVRSGLAKVVSMAGFVQARERSAENRPSGDGSGDEGRVAS